MNNNTKKKISDIKSWLENERPREKIFKPGEHTLSNTELIAILLETVRSSSWISGIIKYCVPRIPPNYKSFIGKLHADLLKRSREELKC